MTELSIIRAAGECGIAEAMLLAAHTVPPKHIAPHLTSRPWNRRAALQIMPSAMNNSTSAIHGGNGGETRPPSCHNVPENPPSR